MVILNSPSVKKKVKIGNYNLKASIRLISSNYYFTTIIRLIFFRICEVLLLFRFQAQKDRAAPPDNVGPNDELHFHWGFHFLLHRRTTREKG